jgi:hypothetical protein
MNSPEKTFHKQSISCYKDEKTRIIAASSIQPKWGGWLIGKFETKNKGITLTDV